MRVLSIAATILMALCLISIAGATRNSDFFLEGVCVKQYTLNCESEEKWVEVALYNSNSHAKNLGGWKISLIRDNVEVGSSTFASADNSWVSANGYRTARIRWESGGFDNIMLTDKDSGCSILSDAPVCSRWKDGKGAGFTKNSARVWSWSRFS